MTTARDVIGQCRDALAEELAAWDIDPPLHHVKAAHDACVTWLAAHPQPAQGEAWREHVEQRIRNWRQRTMNKSGDHLAIDDFMGQESIDDLVDYVCDEWEGPAAGMAGQGLTDERIDHEWALAVASHELTRDFVRDFARRIYGIHPASDKPATPADGQSLSERWNRVIDGDLFIHERTGKRYAWVSGEFHPFTASEGAA